MELDGPPLKEVKMRPPEIPSCSTCRGKHELECKSHISFDRYVYSKVHRQLKAYLIYAKKAFLNDEAIAFAKGCGSSYITPHTRVIAAQIWNRERNLARDVHSIDSCHHVTTCNM